MTRTTTPAPPQPGTAASRRHAARRRLWLLAALLACLVAMLWQRPDLRRPAAAFTRSSAHYLLFDALGLSPRTVYEARLRAAGLYDRPIGRAWRTAVDRASGHATPIGTRYQGDVAFAADRIEARVYTLPLRRGQALRWRLQRHDDDGAALYASLERNTAPTPEARRWQTVRELLADGQAHGLVVAHSGRYRIVLQPELAAAIDATLAVAVGGSLIFPVKGGHAYDIGGGFGVPRDGGKRRHEGVDIFAARGTPVLAVVDGHIREGDSGIGGKHVWLSGGFAGPYFYYAHLDRFAPDNGTSVKKGQIVGYVGNTGNARGGPTHLHFGVYTAGGAIDPAPFIQPQILLPTDGPER